MKLKTLKLLTLAFLASWLIQTASAQELSQNTNQSIQSKVEIFLPAMYRGTAIEDFQHMLKEDWHALYPDPTSEKWLYDKAKISITKEQDDCLMDLSAQVKTTVNSLVLIKGLLPAQGKSLPVTLPSVSLKDFGEDGPILLPGQTFKFNFNKTSYTLEAHGKMKNDSPFDIEYNKVYLSNAASTQKQLIWSQDRFNNTVNQILFIGDLDGDGKPDLIMDVSEDYETMKVVLFLSSHAQKNELVHPAAKTGYHFDC